MEKDNYFCGRWMDFEVKALISIWGDHTAQDKFDGTVRNNKVYRDIQRVLQSRGITRFTATQVRSKIKNMKTLYRKEKELSTKSGGVIKTSPHFQDIDEILGDKVACTPKVVLETRPNEKSISRGATDNATEDAELKPSECNENEPTTSHSPPPSSCILLVGQPGPSHGGTPESRQKLQLKWRNVRDYYRKYTKKETKSGPGASKRFKYIFADQLTFLTPLLETKNAEASGPTDDGSQITEERAEGNSDEPSASNEPVVPAQKPAGSATKPAIKLPKVKLDPKRFFEQFHENCSKPTRRIEDDDNKLFFDSILPVVHTFDIDQRIEFRSEVLRILQRVRNTKFLLQRYQPAGQMEYASSSHFPNIYNQGPTPHLYEDATTNVRETPQKQSQNSKTPAGQSNKTEILNLESPESVLSTFSDDDEMC